MSRETWLNGWPRGGSGVIIGTGVYCAGCGKFHGITTVALHPDAEYKYPDKLPSWPFEEATCPVHNQPPSSTAPDKRDLLTERMVALQRARSGE